MRRRSAAESRSDPPSRLTAPADGRVSPARIRRGVVFPAPLGPRISWIEPGSTAGSTPRRTRAVPKARSIPLAARRDTGEEDIAQPRSDGQTVRRSDRPSALYFEEIAELGEGQQEADFIAGIAEGNNLPAFRRAALDQH